MGMRRSPFNNTYVPQGPTWFDWLPRWLQCALMLLLFVPLTVGSFLGGMHCVHTGKPVMLANTQLDAGEFFFSSLVCLFISGCFFGVMVGWLKPSTPHVSETHHRKWPPEK
jgi:hypothetical protein